MKLRLSYIFLNRLKRVKLGKNLTIFHDVTPWLKILPMAAPRWIIGPDRRRKEEGGGRGRGRTGEEEEEENVTSGLIVTRDWRVRPWWGPTLRVRSS